MSKILQVKSLGDDGQFARVGGYGVYFGGLDIEREGFKSSTDFMLDLVPTKMITYNHTLPASPGTKAVKHFIGESTNESVDDVGIWVEAQLDISKKYVKQVLQLVKRGLIGWSSATAAHLATKTGDYYDRWPIVEYALTPMPAEPRALGVRRLKALVEKNPDLERILAQVSNDGNSPGLMIGTRNLQVKAKAFLMVNDLE